MVGLSDYTKPTVKQSVGTYDSQETVETSFQFALSTTRVNGTAAPNDEYQWFN